jgi:hypothetical protein
MHRRIVFASIFSLIAAIPAISQAQLMIPDAGAGDRVMLFDSFNGSAIDLNWITDIGAVGWFFTTPKEAAVVNNEIWVSDQVADAIHRFDMNRNFIDSISKDHTGVSLDNLRGFGYDGSRVYLTQFHGTSTLRGVVTIDAATASSQSFWPVGTNSLFDAEPFGQNELLISNSTTNNLERRDRSTGAFLGNFATGIVFPQQVATMPDGSIIGVSTIAAAGVEGVYHFNIDGTLRKFIDTEVLKGQIGEQVPRGAWLLGDGGYLITTSIGVYKAVETSPGIFSFSTMAAGVDAQYVNPIPEPATLSVVALAGLLAMRRRS